MNYFKKSNLILGWVAFAVSALVYLLSMEPTASLWDCSEFIATSYKMEVGHPPGAPLFMMLNRFFSMFAPDTSYVAAMVNATSAIASALTIMFLFWTISHLGRRLLNRSEEELTRGETWAVLGAALVGSLAYAFTDTFWFSAVEGEVYAQSSLFTALVFWAILKWENIADQPHANRWLVLVAYLMGLSIGVHLLNLLAIPAIVFVYYYRMSKERSRLGWWKAFAAAVVILAVVLYVIIPKSVELGAWFDKLFVNSFGLPVNSGLLAFVVLLFAAIGFGVWKTHVKGKVLWNTVLLCVGVMLLGYGTYASVVIRSSVNPPMNSNAPSDPYALLDFLNREQYGNRPLFSGPYYNAPLTDIEYTDGYYYNTETKRYETFLKRGKETYDPRFTTLFPRMYSPQYAKEYQSWGGPGGKKVNLGNGETAVVPTFAQNLRYFFTYQLNFMYWRYFLWNFVGRQDDIQSQGELTHGNWMSGITPIDEIYLGPQDNLPQATLDNKGRNHYYFLPFILGLIGIFYQLKRDRNNFTVVMWLFFMTGIAIILYLNQPPLQPRERDYAFAGSFYAFTIWIGLGVLWVYDLLTRKVSQKVAAVAATAVCASVPVILIAQNWDDHSRANRYVARDFGRNYMNATLPNSIIMPYGDNDTFPLWYVQEVEGVRPDVKVMNLSYLGADWYVEQMRVKSNDAAPVPFTLPKKLYYKVNEVIPVIPQISDSVVVEGKALVDFMKNDSKIKQRTLAEARFGDQITMYVPARRIGIPVNKENALASGIVAPEDADRMVDTVYLTITGSQMTRADYMLLDLLGNYDWTRPLYVTSPTQSLTVFDGFLDYLQLDGFAYRFVPIRTEVGEEVSAATSNIGRINSDYLYDKLMNETRLGNVKDLSVYADSFVNNTFTTAQVRSAYGRLAKQLAAEGDTLRAAEVVRRAAEEMPASQIAHNYTSFNLIEACFQIGETELGRQMLNEFREAMLDELLYLAQFQGQKAQSVRQDLEISLYYLQHLYILAQQTGQADIAEEMEALFRTLQGE